MEWSQTNAEQAHAVFRFRLEAQVLDQIFDNEELMRDLRHNYERLKTFKSAIKNVLASKGLDLEEEIIKRTMPKVPPVPGIKISPVGGVWDEEDDQKQNGAADDGTASSCSADSDASLVELRNKRLLFFKQ